jgi:hypothetical protein
MDRSALRFDAPEPGRPREMVNAVMDPHYAGKPSMISETTFNRPNRYRSEAPLYYAAYGALQGSNGMVHFAMDGARWRVKPGYFMQPWTLASPAMMGQFPAAALIYRLGLVGTGPVLADVNLNVEDLLRLKGTPLPQDATLDELRLKDVPAGAEWKPGQRIDPLLHYAGRAVVSFAATPGGAKVSDLSRLVDANARTVRSATGELALDYGRGLLVINAACAQGASGNLQAAETVRTRDLEIVSDMDLLHVVAVTLDGRPLATSRRMLLQVMTEEKASGFQTEDAGGGLKRIVDIGHDPWLVRKARGTVVFTRPDAAALLVTALDCNGRPVKALGTASKITLEPETMYYLLEGGR